MPADPKQRVGRQGEDLAADYLQRLGYKILERNYRSRHAEIDVIAKHKGELVFVEVKSRRSLRYGGPKQALTPAKQRKISMAALTYLKRKGAMNRRARFDVVTIQHRDGNLHIEVIDNAFELAYP
jgi:putative endonuclease